MAGGSSAIPGSAQNPSFGRNFAGSIDEVRSPATARSPDWITAEYNNQIRSRQHRRGRLLDLRGENFLRPPPRHRGELTCVPSS